MVVGAELSQRKPGKPWYPIAFFSKTLTASERKYSAFDRELLAMYISTKYFRHFLEGRSFIIYTDHKPLTFALASSSDRSPRQTRNLLLLRNSRVILDMLKEWRTWWRTLCQDQRLLMSLYPLSITLKWQFFKIQLQWRISVFRWSGSLGRVWIYGAIPLKQVLDQWCRRNSEYQSSHLSTL